MSSLDTSSRRRLGLSPTPPRGLTPVTPTTTRDTTRPPVQTGVPGVPRYTPWVVTPTRLEDVTPRLLLPSRIYPHSTPTSGFLGGQRPPHQPHQKTTKKNRTKNLNDHLSSKNNQNERRENNLVSTLPRLMSLSSQTPVWCLLERGSCQLRITSRNPKTLVPYHLDYRLGRPIHTLNPGSRYR